MSLHCNLSFFKIAGVLSIVQAILYVAAIIALIFMPPAQVLGTMDQFVSFYIQNPYSFNIMAFSFAVMGLLGFIAVAPATAAAFEKNEPGLMAIGKYMALLCLSATTIYFTWLLSTTSDKVALYRSADFFTQTALSISNQQAPLNWIAWFTFGGMGLWVLIAGWVASLQKECPKGFVAACLIKTIGFWLILSAYITHSMFMAQIGAVLGGLIGGPLYHVILGCFLYQHRTTQPSR